MASKLEPLARPRPDQLLSRILDEPELVQMVQALEPRALGKLIAHVGLEDAGEIVSLATTAQLEKIFDEDLWKSERPGQSESFDAERFALWLEVMLEAGAPFVADKLTDLPEDLVTLGFQRQILVLDLEQIAGELEGRSHTDPIEEALENCPYHEFEEYRVIARRADGWDAILSVLLALDRDHHEFLDRVLASCCHASAEYIEDNGGLYDVLTSEELLESDAAAEREDRRTAAGFVTPSSAVSFLALARTTPLEQIVASQTRDPVTHAYFREVASHDQPARSAAETKPVTEEAEPSKLLQMLHEAQVVSEPRSPLLLSEGAGAQPATELPFKRALIALRERDVELCSQRMEELAYLANVLLSGASILGRAFRPFETVEAAMAVCNLGLELLLARAAGKSRAGAEIEQAAELLATESADKLFRVGWSVLHHEIAMVTGHALERALLRAASSTLGSRPAMQVARLLALLRTGLAQGKPWSVRTLLAETTGVFDDTELAALAALLDDLPTLPSSLASSELDDTRELHFFASTADLRKAQSWLTSKWPEA
jgi:hypothetical protein